MGEAEHSSAEHRQRHRVHVRLRLCVCLCCSTNTFETGVQRVISSLVADVVDETDISMVGTSTGTTSSLNDTTT